MIKKDLILSKILELRYSLIMLFLALALLIAICNVKISLKAQSYCYDNQDLLPRVKTALVLGTSKYLAKGISNPYFAARMNAASELYFRGKVSYILVSGDNSNIYYNEPIMMKKSLVNRGVPDSVIYLDYAGFRTLDAVVRAKKVFLQDSILIVSQKFHNERAIYLAMHYNINAFAYNAEDLKGSNSLKTKIREIFARVKVFLDIYILGTQPKFLGDEIIIGP